MLRKLIHIIVWAGILAYLGIALSFTEKMENSIMVDSIIVEVVDSADYKFIERKDIIGTLNKFGIKITGMKADSVNRSAIREAVYDISEIKDVNVFFKHENELHIKVWQRKPVLRIKSGDMDYYLDEENKEFRFRPGFSPKVMLISGFIGIDYARERLFPMVRFIQQDPFLRSLIMGIYVDSRQRLELITRIENHRVYMGDANGYEWKFAKLTAFYEEAIPKVGWDKYSSIHLDFGDQVVCKKDINQSINSS